MGRNVGFEKYAQNKPMDGPISDDFIKIINPIFSRRTVDDKLLDFGCGDGKFFSLFVKYFTKENIFGVDVSRIRIGRCQKRGWKNSYLIKYNGKTSFADNFFDYINMNQVIEHIPYGQIDFWLAEISRVLKPDGFLILTTPNYPVKRIYDIVGALINFKWSQLFDDPTHVSFYNFSKVSRLMKRYFDGVLIKPSGGRLFSIFKNNFFSHKIIVLCSKKKKL